MVHVFNYLNKFFFISVIYTLLSESLPLSSNTYMKSYYGEGLTSRTRFSGSSMGVTSGLDEVSGFGVCSGLANAPVLGVFSKLTTDAAGFLAFWFRLRFFSALDNFGSSYLTPIVILSSWHNTSYTI